MLRAKVSFDQGFEGYSAGLLPTQLDPGLLKNAF